MKQLKSDLDDDLLPEYEFDYSKGVRGKYYQRLMEEGSNSVVIQPDVFEVFPDSESVNAALHTLIEISKITGRIEAVSRRHKVVKPKEIGRAHV